MSNLKEIQRCDLSAHTVMNTEVNKHSWAAASMQWITILKKTAHRITVESGSRYLIGLNVLCLHELVWTSQFSNMAVLFLGATREDVSKQIRLLKNKD